MNLVFHGLCRAVGYFSEQCETRFPLGEGHQGLFMPFADQGIRFPVTQAFSAVDQGWQLFNTGAVQQLAMTYVLAMPFAPLLLTA